MKLKENKSLLNTKLSDVAAELTRQLEEAQKKHEKELNKNIKEV